MDEELDRFKRLPLPDYAAAIGYRVDRRESSRNSMVMRRDHDKIIISRKPDGHFTYWSPRDDDDHGTIIDFLQRRKGLSLGGVRKELRAWSGIPAAPLPSLPELKTTAKDIEAVRRRYAAMPLAYRHAYLEEARGIPASVLQHSRFAGKIKADRHAAAVFPHTDADGQICGYELKNKFSDGRTFTGFASGGRKGIFLSNTDARDRRLVLTESGVDALSHAAIFGDLEVTRYGSFAGKPTAAQHSIIRAAMLAMPGGSVIVAATDNDDAGTQYGALLKEIFDGCGRADLGFRRDEPAGAKDWNEILLRKRKPPLPRRPEEPHVA